MPILDDCSYPGCTANVQKGDTILRISAKGGPFVGRCKKHYGPGGEEQAQEAEAARDQAKAAGLSPQNPVKHLPE